MLVGNGGSAAIASHQAVDLWRNAGIRAVAFNDASLAHLYRQRFQLRRGVLPADCDVLRPGDLLVAISSSGKSKNILNSVTEAQKAWDAKR